MQFVETISDGARGRTRTRCYQYFIRGSREFQHLLQRKLVTFLCGRRNVQVLYILPLSVEAIYLTSVAYVVLLGEYQLAARQQTKNVLASPRLI